MLKKRVIFTLLHEDGHFFLSRNFRLQKVGNLRWLNSNYKFSQVALSIDELVILDVSRNGKNHDKFSDVIRSLAENTFVPLAAGGGVRNIEHARQILKSGADKVVINTMLFEEPNLVTEIASQFGSQSIIASVDCKYDADKGDFIIYVDNGRRPISKSFRQALEYLQSLPVGELYLNSIDRDGTGFGYDMRLLQHLPERFKCPLILAGGVGKGAHLAEGLNQSAVDAVATAHLFNFVGDGLRDARRCLLQDDFDLAVWDEGLIAKLEGYFKN